MICFNCEILQEEKNVINNIIDYNEENEFELYNLKHKKYNHYINIQIYNKNIKKFFLIKIECSNYNEIILNKKNEEKSKIIFSLNSKGQNS